MLDHAEAVLDELGWSYEEDELATGDGSVDCLFFLHAHHQILAIPEGSHLTFLLPLGFDRKEAEALADLDSDVKERTLRAVRRELLQNPTAAYTFVPYDDNEELLQEIQVKERVVLSGDGSEDIQKVSDRAQSVVNSAIAVQEVLQHTVGALDTDPQYGHTEASRGIEVA
jgi:hypothetical protein